MWRDLFPHCCVLWGRTKPWEVWDPKADNIYTVGVGSLQIVTQKGGSCIPWNPISPREAHENVFIRNDLHLMCRGLFPHCCVLWERTKPWGVWGHKADNIYIDGVGSLQMVLKPCPSQKCGPYTRGRMYPEGGWIVVTQKGGSYIPWNPTSSREAHRNVFIRNDFPSMCRGLFPHCCVLWGRTKL